MALKIKKRASSWWKERQKERKLYQETRKREAAEIKRVKHEAKLEGIKQRAIEDARSGGFSGRLGRGASRIGSGIASGIKGAASSGNSKGGKSRLESALGGLEVGGNFDFGLDSNFDFGIGGNSSSRKSKKRRKSESWTFF